jgi:ATP-dependent RNA helicase DHX29
MAKKKKSSLKPVARPIATTSIAKKVIEKPPEEAPAEVSESKLPANTNDSEAAKASQQQTEEYDIDRAEIESLQLLVDQQQAKAEREALRSIKVCIILTETWFTYPILYTIRL